MDLDKLKLETTVHALRAENKALENKLENQYKELKKLESRLYSGKDCDTYEQWKLKSETQLQYYVELMVAAYAKECNIPVTNVVVKCCIGDDGKALYYWAEKDNIKIDEVIQTCKWTT